MEVNWGILRTGNTGKEMISAFEAGQSNAQKRQEYARKEGARSALSNYQTDPEGTVSALFQYDPETAMKLGDYTRGQKEAAARKERGSLYATDPKAGRTAALAAGDTDQVMTFDKMEAGQREIVEANAKKAYAIVGKLAEMPYEQRKAAWLKLAPAVADEFGFPAETLAQVDPTDEWIVAKKIEGAEFEAKAQSFQAGREVRGVNPQTGEQKWALSLPADPLDVETKRAQIENQRSSSRRAEEDQRLEREKWEYERDNPGASEVLGRIQSKLASGQTLTPGEQKIYDDSRTARIDPNDPYGGGGGGGSYSGGGYGKPPAGAAGASGTAVAPYRPMSAADFAKVPLGAYYVNPSDGRTLKRVK